MCELTKQWGLYNNCKVMGALKAFVFQAEEHLKQAFQDKRPAVVLRLPQSPRTTYPSPDALGCGLTNLFILGLT